MWMHEENNRSVETGIGKELHCGVHLLRQMDEIAVHVLAWRRMRGVKSIKRGRTRVERVRQLRLLGAS